MALATCSAFQGAQISWPLNWGVSGRYKIIADREFVFGSKVYPAGRISDPIDSNWCELGTITVASGVPTFSAFTLPQTDVGITVVNGSGEPTYTLIYYDSSGTKRGQLFMSWRIGASLTASFNFESLAIYNSSISVINPRTDFIGTDAVNNLITARLYAPATTTQLGLVKVSNTPTDAANPIAVETTDIRMKEVFDAQFYGWLPDGTDRSTQALALLSTVAAAGGGTIYFPPATGVYRADSQLLIPNDGASPQPNQKNIRFTGAGGGHAWYGVNAVVLDLRYQAVDGNAKIESRGLGTLEIDHLTIKDGSAANNTPLVHVTNTTPVIHHNTFIGTGVYPPVNQSQARNAQDAIVLGGTDAAVGNGVNAPFQGYAPYIHANHFRQLNRWVYGRNYANSVTVTDNSGQGNTGTVAIEFVGRAYAQGLWNYGLIVTGNSIEMDVYVYGIKLTNTVGGFFSNSFYDGGSVGITGNNVAFHNLTNSPGNTFIHLSSGEATFSPVAFSGDNLSLTQTNSIGGLPPNVGGGGAYQMDVFGYGRANTEFGNNLVVRGSYDSTHANGYPGQLAIADASSPSTTLRLGYNAVTADYAFIDATKNGIGPKPLLLNSFGFGVYGSSGMVGIGNMPATALARPLHVGVDGTGGAQRWGDTVNTNYLDLVVSGSNTIFGSSAARNFLLNNNNVNKIRLDANGDIIITQDNLTSRTRMYVNTGAFGLRIGDTADTNYLDFQVGGSQTQFVSSANRPLFFTVNGIEGLRIDGTGAVTNPVSLSVGGGTALTTTNRTGTGNLVLDTKPTIGLLIQTEGAVLTVSGNAITPTNTIHHVGAGLIKTITVPSGFTSGVLYIIPDAAFTTDATGNIASTATTAVVGKVMVCTYSSSSSKWYLSY